MRGVFVLCTWHPYGSLTKCTEVLDVVELDLWSSDKRALFFFLYKYHKFSTKISNNLQISAVFILATVRPPYALPQTYVTRKTSKNEEGPVVKLLKTLFS
jgi:hypothetical protein